MRAAFIGIALGLVLALVGASCALAATASVSGFADGRPYVAYDAQSGERNVLRATADGSTLTLSDRVPITAGPGCATVNVTTVVCGSALPDRFGVPGEPLGVVAQLGDENDIAVGSSQADIINGGAGNDVLFGGDGGDRLDGGPGADLLLNPEAEDQLTGGGGEDRYVLDPRIPLGDQDIRPAVSCMGSGIVENARGQTLLDCPRVRLGAGITVAAAPRLTQTSAKVTLRCPTPPRAMSGRCTGRIIIGLRRRGQARFTIPFGQTRTISVPLRRGRSTSTRYKIAISAAGHYRQKTTSLRGSWIIRLPIHRR